MAHDTCIRRSNASFLYCTYHFLSILWRKFGMIPSDALSGPCITSCRSTLKTRTPFAHFIIQSNWSTHLDPRESTPSASSSVSVFSTSASPIPASTLTTFVCFRHWTCFNSHCYSTLSANILNNPAHLLSIGLDPKFPNRKRRVGETKIGLGSCRFREAQLHIASTSDSELKLK